MTKVPGFFTVGDLITTKYGGSRIVAGPEMDAMFADIEAFIASRVQPELPAAINGAFDALMERRTDGLIGRELRDELLGKIIAIRVAAGIR